jgi:single-strand DNA-binding protein
MRNINNVVIAGNIVRDAEFDRVCKFSVAVNSTTKDEDGDYVDYPNFIDCVVFGAFGASIGDKLTKGTKVTVQGSLHQSRWEDKDGNKRSKLEVWVDNIELAPRKRVEDEEPIPFDDKPAKKKSTRRY